MDNGSGKECVLVVVLAESRIPLQLVLGGVRIVAFSISSHEQTE